MSLWLLLSFLSYISLLDDRGIRLMKILLAEYALRQPVDKAEHYPAVLWFPGTYLKKPKIFVEDSSAESRATERRVYSQTHVQFLGLLLSWCAQKILFSSFHPRTLRWMASSFCCGAGIHLGPPGNAFRYVQTLKRRNAKRTHELNGIRHPDRVWIPIHSRNTKYLVLV